MKLGEYFLLGWLCGSELSASKFQEVRRVFNERLHNNCKPKLHHCPEGGEDKDEPPLFLQSAQIHYIKYAWRAAFHPKIVAARSVSGEIVDLHSFPMGPGANNQYSQFPKILWPKHFDFG